MFVIGLAEIHHLHQGAEHSREGLLYCRIYTRGFRGKMYEDGWLNICVIDGEKCWAHMSHKSAMTVRQIMSGVCLCVRVKDQSLCNVIPPSMKNFQSLLSKWTWSRVESKSRYPYPMPRILCMLYVVCCRNDSQHSFFILLLPRCALMLINMDEGYSIFTYFRDFGFVFFLRELIFNTH